jgi:hypothetical protein
MEVRRMGAARGPRPRISFGRRRKEDDLVPEAEREDDSTAARIRRFRRIYLEAERRVNETLGRHKRNPLGARGRKL